MIFNKPTYKEAIKEIKPENTFYVYFLRADISGVYKIGITNNPLKRLYQLQTSCPYRLKIRYLFDCENQDNAYKLEKHFHKKFKKHRMNGEWFSKDLKTIIRKWMNDFYYHNISGRTGFLYECIDFVFQIRYDIFKIFNIKNEKLKHKQQEKLENFYKETRQFIKNNKYNITAFNIKVNALLLFPDEKMNVS